MALADIFEATIVKVTTAPGEVVTRGLVTNSTMWKVKDTRTEAKRNSFALMEQPVAHELTASLDGDTLQQPASSSGKGSIVTLQQE